MLDEKEQGNAAAPEGAAVAVKTEEKPTAVYDAQAENRFEFEVNDGGEIYDTAHVFGPDDDERYIKWQKDWNVRGKVGQDEVDNDEFEADVKFWDDTIVRIGNIEVPEGADFRQLISPSEKSESLKQRMAVAIVTPEKKNDGVRKLGGATDEQLVVTEAWFNNQPVQQKHFTKKKNFELQKRFDRINRKQFKQQQISGLYKQRPNVSFVPQPARFGELYDEMVIRTEGFAGDLVPLRFKIAVVNYVFAPKLDPKLVGK